MLPVPESLPGPFASPEVPAPLLFPLTSVAVELFPPLLAGAAPLVAALPPSFVVPPPDTVVPPPAVPLPPLALPFPLPLFPLPLPLPELVTGVGAAGRGVALRAAGGVAVGFGGRVAVA